MKTSLRVYIHAAVLVKHRRHSCLPGVPTASAGSRNRELKLQRLSHLDQRAVMLYHMFHRGSAEKPPECLRWHCKIPLHLWLFMLTLSDRDGGLPEQRARRPTLANRTRRRNFKWGNKGRTVKVFFHSLSTEREDPEDGTFFLAYKHICNPFNIQVTIVMLVF